MYASRQGKRLTVGIRLFSSHVSVGVGNELLVSKHADDDEAQHATAGMDRKGIKGVIDLENSLYQNRAHHVDYTREEANADGSPRLQECVSLRRQLPGGAGIWY